MMNICPNYRGVICIALAILLGGCVASKELNDCARKGRIECVEKYLRMQDIDLEYNLQGRTALGGAARGGYYDIVVLLADHGANIHHIESKTKHSILSLALAGNHPEIAMFLIERGVDLNTRNKYGETPLLIALEFPEVVGEMLARGADVNALTGRKTPLMWAAKDNRVATMKLLLNHGADINHQDSKGRTALTFARKKKHAEAMAILLKAGADPDLGKK